MRYYTIQVLNADGSQMQLPSGFGPAIWTSFVNGVTDLGALQVELDLPIQNIGNPIGAASVKIWGVPLQLLSQAADFNGKFVNIYGGMQAGLPLASPAQSGLLLTGQIYQAFGNWIGTTQYLEFIVYTEGAPDALGGQQNITFTWPKGTQLSDAIKQCFKTAAPTYKTVVNVSDKLVPTEDIHGFFYNMAQFATYLKQTSAAIINGQTPPPPAGYQGVDFTITQGAFTVFDGTTKTTPKLIAFNDLIGQPTWIAYNQIQVILVMRADLSVGDFVTMPATLVTTTAESLSQFRDQAIFQSSFQIYQMRHVGNFRQPDAQSWITAIDCFPTAASAAPAA